MKRFFVSKNRQTDYNATVFGNDLSVQGPARSNPDKPLRPFGQLLTGGRRKTIGVLPPLTHCEIGGRIVLPGSIQQVRDLGRLKPRTPETSEGSNAEEEVQNLNSPDELLGLSSLPDKVEVKGKGQLSKKKSAWQIAREALNLGGSFNLPDSSEVYKKVNSAQVPHHCSSDLMWANIANVPTQVCTNCAARIGANVAEAARLHRSFEPESQFHPDENDVIVGPSLDADDVRRELVNQSARRSLGLLGKARSTMTQVVNKALVSVGRPPMETAQNTIPSPDKWTHQYTERVEGLSPETLSQMEKEQPGSTADLDSETLHGLDSTRREFVDRARKEYVGLLAKHGLFRYLSPQDWDKVDSPVNMEPSSMAAHMKALGPALSKKSDDTELLKNTYLQVARKLRDPQNPDELEFQSALQNHHDGLGELQREKLGRALTRSGYGQEYSATGRLPNLDQWKSIIRDGVSTQSNFRNEMKSMVDEHTKSMMDIRSKYDQAAEESFGRNEITDEDQENRERATKNLQDLRTKMGLPPYGTRPRFKAPKDNR